MMYNNSQVFILMITPILRHFQMELMFEIPYIFEVSLVNVKQFRKFQSISFKMLYISYLIHGP
jgi:hypothetical protein